MAAQQAYKLLAADRSSHATNALELTRNPGLKLLAASLFDVSWHQEGFGHGFDQQEATAAFCSRATSIWLKRYSEWRRTGSGELELQRNHSHFSKCRYAQ